MASHVSQVTRTWLVLLLAATGVVVAVPGAAAGPPKPSPRIAFEGTPNQGSQVVVSRPDGTRQRRFTSAPNTAELPRWSPFGTRILYLRRTPNDQFDQMVMGARGRHKHQLLSGRNRDIIDMAWGAGGRRVALTMQRAADAVSDVFIYSLRTRKLTKLHASSDPDRDPTLLTGHLTAKQSPSQPWTTPRMATTSKTPTCTSSAPTEPGCARSPTRSPEMSTAHGGPATGAASPTRSRHRPVRVPS